MYRYSFRYNSEHCPASLLRAIGAVLLALQLFLSSVAFASSTQSSYSFGISQALDQASVSVVRLRVSYAANPLVSGCTTSKTGLGVLVGSWARSTGSTTINDWVLTDGSLVNPGGLTCGSGSPTAPLTTIEIYSNTAYAGSTTASTPVPSARLLASVPCQPQSCSGGRIICQITPTCSDGVVLVPFQTTVPQPFIDIASSNQATPALGIELTGPSALPPTFEQAVQFLAPAPVSSLSAPNNELGMPIVNGRGQLVDMNTKGTDSAGSIRTFVTQQLAPAPVQAANTNALHDAWNSGISDFYANNLASAQTQFRNAAKPNPLFQAPSAFLKLPAFQGNSGGRNATAGVGRRAPFTGQSTNLFGFTIPNSQVIWLVIGGVVLLVLLLLFLALALIRRRAQRRRELARYEEEQRVADQKAAKDAARIAEQERAERQRAQGQHQQTVPVAKNVGTPGVQPISNLRCYNCGQSVLPDDIFCSNCRAPLPPVQAGLQGRATIPPSSLPPSPRPVLCSKWNTPPTAPERPTSSIDYDHFLCQASG